MKLKIKHEGEIRTVQLSEAQVDALKKMKLGKWHTAYELRVSLRTLTALVRKNICKSYSGIGASFFPQNEIYFKIALKKNPFDQEKENEDDEQKSLF